MVRAFISVEARIRAYFESTGRVQNSSLKTFSVCSRDDKRHYTGREKN